MRSKHLLYNHTMTISIVQRKLTSLEIKKLIKETKSFPDLIYVSSSHWHKFKKPYCLLVDNNFAGVCAIYDRRDFVKIGPLVILNKFSGKGLGKKMLQHVIQENKNKSLLITSSNQFVGKIVLALGFEKIPNAFLLTTNMRLFLVGQLFEYLNLQTIKEWLRKRKLSQRGKREFYLKFIALQS